MPGMMPLLMRVLTISGLLLISLFVKIIPFAEFLSFKMSFLELKLRMVFGGKTKFEAIRLKLSAVEFVEFSLSSFKVNVLSNLDFSTLTRANFRLSLTVLPKIKLPKIVAAAIE